MTFAPDWMTGASKHGGPGFIGDPLMFSQDKNKMEILKALMGGGKYGMGAGMAMGGGIKGLSPLALALGSFGGKK